jgi:hypothetical protein
MTYPVAAEQDDPVPPTPPPAPAKRRTGVIVLSIVFALLLGAAGTLGFLCFDALSRRDALNARLTDLDKQQWDVTSQVLDGNDRLTKALTAQHSAEDAQKKAETTGRVVVECQKAARDMREADLGGTGDAAFQAAGQKLFTVC